MIIATIILAAACAALLPFALVGVERLSRERKAPDPPTAKTTKLPYDVI